MFITSPEELNARKSFIKKLKVYLHAVDTRCYRVHKKKNKVVMPGTMVRLPEFDMTHVFNNGAMLALSHSIEDLANEAKGGELIVTFQDFSNFEPRRQRYFKMARKLNSIRIWGQGMLPDDCSGVDFVPVLHPEIMRYWVVIFSGKKTNAILVGKQINTTKDIEKKYFMGFYSLNPFVVQSLKRSFSFINSGLDGAVQSWEEKCNFPKLSARDLNRFLPKKVPSPCAYSRRASMLMYASEA